MERSGSAQRSGIARRVISQARRYDLGDLKAAIGSNPVDVFGQGQSLAILNGLITVRGRYSRVSSGSRRT